MAGAKILGQNLTEAPRYKEYMEQAGFVDVVERQVAWPIGPWTKDLWLKQLGAVNWENVDQALQGLSMAVCCRGLGMTSQEVEIMLVDVRKDLNSRRLHVYIPQ